MEYGNNYFTFNFYGHDLQYTVANTRVYDMNYDETYTTSKSFTTKSKCFNYNNGNISYLSPMGINESTYFLFGLSYQDNHHTFVLIL